MNEPATRSEGLFPQQEWLRYRPAVLFLFSLPFLIGDLVYSWFWEAREEECRLGEERNLRGILTAWAAESKPESGWQRILRAAEKKIFQRGMTVSGQKAVLKNLHRRFPGMFIFTVLDGRGLPIEALCDRPQPRVAWQRVDRAYRQFLQGNPLPWAKVVGTARHLHGRAQP